MSETQLRPIIIKRKKVISGGGHHGGAWKVAYADFVTAMMAFFMLMWLLNATTEQQRKGIADYFAPTIPIVRISGGGEAPFSGDDIFSQNTLADSGTGGLQSDEDAMMAQTQEQSDTAFLQELEQVLIGKGGESLLSDLALRHVVTELTDEGLAITIFEREGAPLFLGDGRPSGLLLGIIDQFTELAGQAPNGIAIYGHQASYPTVRRDRNIWQETFERAEHFRAALVATGVPPTKIKRLEAYADRRAMKIDPMAVENNRIEMIVLRN